MNPLVSIVIPTLREAEIGHTLDVVCATVEKIEGYSFEIFIVDDSEDLFRRSIRDHLALHRQSASLVGVELIEGHRRGKGDAVRLGVLATRGDVVVTMDADLPVALMHLEPFVRRVWEGKIDVVIAERPASRHAARPFRSLLSRTLRLLQQRLVFQSSRFSDTQCGFKAFAGPMLRDMAAHQIVQGGMVDVEYLYMAMLRAAPIEAVPVAETVDRPDTRINLLRCVVVDPVDLLRIKTRAALGGYR
jgi:glycosyltransferase involved in cell wall biosynthesis